jgi:hypothetical protein
VVAEMRQDDLAREILGRVDSGPYVCPIISNVIFRSLNRYRVHRGGKHSLRTLQRRTSSPPSSEAIMRPLMLILQEPAGSHEYPGK